MRKPWLSYFFNPLPNRYYIKQNPVAPSEFPITRVHCTKYIFFRYTSAISHLYGYICMTAELWVTEHWGFMKDFVSFTVKYIHPFSVFFYKDRSVSIQARNLRIFASEILNTPQCPLKTSVRIISLVFNWAQVRPAINGTEKNRSSVLFCNLWLASITVLVLVWIYVWFK